MANQIGPIDGLIYYTRSVVDMWAEKAILSSVIAWFVAFFGADEFLIWLMLFMLMADFCFGLCEAFSRGRFRCQTLLRGVGKFPVYCLYLLLVGAVNASLNRSLDTSLPILDLFIAYLVITDAVSIMGHMIHLGWPVPELLSKILVRGKHSIEHKVDKIFAEDQSDEHNEH